MSQATTDMLTEMAAIHAIGLDNQLREQRWIRLHPNWGELRWPDYTDGGVDMFRVYRLDDPDTGIEVDRLCGWSVFVHALEAACCDGTCGIDHSADPPAGGPVPEAECDLQQQLDRLLDWMRQEPDDGP